MRRNPRDRCRRCCRCPRLGLATGSTPAELIELRATTRRQRLGDVGGLWLRLRRLATALPRRHLALSLGRELLETLLLLLLGRAFGERADQVPDDEHDEDDPPEAAHWVSL